MGVVGAQQVGRRQVIALFDGLMVEDARTILVKPTMQGDPWEAHADLLNDAGQIEMVMGAYVIPAGDRNVLVDAGIGNINNATMSGGQMLESLAGVGLTPDDITDVVLTHLHFDHVGWATSKGQVVFTNATYRCHAADWAHFIEGDSADPGAVRKLTPVIDRLELFDTDHTLAPGIDLRHAPGHTPGSVIVIVSDGDARAMLIGDIAHCPAELAEDDWEAIFDLDRELARRTREALAKELEGTTTLVGAAHFPGLQFGRLLTGTGQRSWVFA